MNKINYQRNLSIKERGQAIILIAFAVIGVVAIVGLMMDGGILLLEYDRLKRSVDAAAISASLQFREGYTIAGLTETATDFLILNSVNIDQVSITVETCDSVEIKLLASPADPALLALESKLCTTPPRKLVYVNASQEVPFSFMKVIGIDSTTITTDAVGEAASVDLVLVLDASQSMAAEGGGDPSVNDVPEDDPSQCNPTNTCHPFSEIKAAAISLVQQLFFPYDRVAIVTFDRNPHWWMALSDTDGLTAIQAEAAIVTAIGGLTVFEPPPCTDPFTPSHTHCLFEDPGTGTYIGFEYPMFRAGPDGTFGTADDLSDPSSRPSSNIGGGLAVAGEQFAAARENSLWVVVTLAGGPANTGCTHTEASYVDDCSGKNVFSQGRICPVSAWDSPLCRDPLPLVRHTDSDADYDADDYARDMADWVADPDYVGALIYTIGLGNLVIDSPSHDTIPPGLTKDCANANHYDQPGAAGERLLCYIAEHAGGASANHGIYQQGATANLQDLFRAIADNIAIRLSQ